jgi:nucleotide-binding universal stress UspA family protein
LRFIKEERIGMVVMAKHGAKGHFRVGSVSRKVMENSLVPVVTIPIGSKKNRGL